MAKAAQTIAGFFLEKLKKQSANIKNNSEKSKSFFRNAARIISGKRINVNDIFKQNVPRLREHGKLKSTDIGRMFMFFYDPKHKQTLPYYDRFPLMIPINIKGDRILGLNLHYLPWVLRARLMDGLYEIYNNKHLDERRKLDLTYKKLKSVSNLKYFKPCVKVYLMNHIRSRLFKVPVDQWDIFLMLPVERFEKKSKSFVWKESEKKLNLSRNKSRHLKL